MLDHGLHRLFAFLIPLFFLFIFNPPLFANSPKETVQTKQALRLKKPVARVGRDPGAAGQQQREISQIEGLEHVVESVRAGDTPIKLLERLGIFQPEREGWRRSVQRGLPHGRLAQGKEIHFYFKPAMAGTGKVGTRRQLIAVEAELEPGTIFTWKKGIRGILLSKRIQPEKAQVKTVSGTVQNSFFEDGQKLGLSSALLSQLADIFSWDIDFDSEIQQGDTFKFLYEEREQTGKANSFRILAAELMSSGKKHFAVYFEKKKGQGNYYDLYGQSLARAFLRFPLEFSRVSSPFSQARLHPILNEERPHHGVDFTAVRGTPVRAIGDGKIEYAGWRRGGYGRLVEVSHSSEYGSRYAHLQGFARGIRKGTRVKKGQIIGFVGSSGRTTGPHLHFELYRGEERLDPLTIELPPEDSLDPVLLKVFEDAKQLFLTELAPGQSS
jgi:murein DD-endopeptidase MepM/ murein hydrolase activator NlpD